MTTEQYQPGEAPHRHMPKSADAGRAGAPNAEWLYEFERVQKILDHWWAKGYPSPQIQIVLLSKRGEIKKTGAILYGIRSDMVGGRPKG